MPTVSVEKASFAWDGGAVSGFWHHPARGATYLVLGHGAGGNLHTSSLVRFAEALAEAGGGAVRFNFPSAEAKRICCASPCRCSSCRDRATRSPARIS